VLHFYNTILVDQKSPICYNIHIDSKKEPQMTDQVISVIEGVGEVGIDTEASPGNGAYYVKHYASGHDVCGFDTVDEAMEELLAVAEDWD
jgi:hypothetical protein